MAKLPIPFSNPQTYPGHSGIDFPQPRGTQVRASGPGRVGLRNSNPRGGNMVWIDYDGYPGVAYAHLDDYRDSPPVGSRVVEGQVICRVGNTGNSTGPHLHMEVYGHGSTDGFWQFFDRSRAVGGTAAGGGAGFSQKVQNEQAWLISRGYDLGSTGADGIAGPMYSAAVKAYQTYLKGRGWYGGDIDGDWGSGTQAGHEKFYAEVAGTPSGGLVVDGDWGSATTRALQTRLGVTVDGELGPDTIRALQTWLKVPADGEMGPQTVSALQAAVGAPVDGELGPQTISAMQTSLNSGGFAPHASTPPVTPPIGDEAAFTPDLKTPSAADFPAWIRFEVVLDPEAQKPTLNKDAAAYYGKTYNPIESHTHWWGEPGKAGSHDGNVEHIRSAADLSVNFVTSAGRVTLMVPLNKIALTTGQRNPYAWKSENDPLITTSPDDLGYRTLGFLHYLVEKLNPRLRGEPIRLHKEFNSTSCSNIDTGKVRAIAEKFASGELDPATGKPPVVVDPGPDADLVEVPRAEIEKIRDWAVRWLA